MLEKNCCKPDADGTLGSPSQLEIPSFQCSNPPLVSIILDNYNYAKFLPEALESCLVQTYKNFELIIVDDGSSDDSRDIIASFVEDNAQKGFKIKTVFRENGGQTAAFNSGFALADGDIICFLDSDDVWFKNKLEKVVNAHLTSGCHIVHHVETTDPAFNPYHSEFRPFQESPRAYSRVKTGVDWHSALMAYGYMCHHSSCSSMSYSKHILDRIFPLVHPEKMRFCSDTVVFTCCLCLTGMYKLDEVLSYYRMHESNVYAGKFSGSEDKRLTDKIRAYCIEQLSSKNLTLPSFDPVPYFEHLLSDFLQGATPLSKKPLAIYGTASVGTVFHEILSDYNVPVSCFVDSNPSKQGTSFLGLPVIAPKEIRSMGVLALIASWASRDIEEILGSLGLKEDEDYVTFDI